jgi:hypothetical protein
MQYQNADKYQEKNPVDCENGRGPIPQEAAVGAVQIVRRTLHGCLPIGCTDADSAGLHAEMRSESHFRGIVLGGVGVG